MNKNKDMDLFLSYLKEIYSTNPSLDVLSDTIYNENEHNGQNNYDEVYSIEIGKYISDKMMLKYTNSINYDDHRFGIQYDLSKNMSILNEWDSRDGYRVTLDANIKF